MGFVPIVGAAEMLLIAILSSGVGIPLGVPPGDPDPVLAQIAPETCLYYTTWAGMAAPDPQSENQTEQLLAEPEIQQFAKEVELAIKKAALQMAVREDEPMAINLAQQLPDLLKKLITHPTAIFVESVELKPGGFDAQGAIVINLGDDADAVRDAVNALADRVLDRMFERVEVGGVRCLRVLIGLDYPSVTWGTKDGYLLIGLGEGSIEGVLQRMETPAPVWLTDAQASFDVPRPSTFTYANVEALVDIVSAAAGPNVQQLLEPLGLSSLKASVSTSGLDETRFVSRTRIVTSGRETGLLSLLAGQPLEAKDLSKIPRDASLAFALHLDAARVLDESLKIMRDVEPRMASEMEDAIRQLEQPLGIHLKEDLLQALGDVWTLHAAPSGGGLIAGWTATVKVRDSQQLEKTHKQLLQVIQAMFGLDPRAPRVESSSFKGQTIYWFDVPEPEFFVVPSWCITETHLVVTLLPQTLKAYLSQSDADGSLADDPTVANLFSSNPPPFAISYQDTRSHFLTFYPWLQVAAMATSKQLRSEGYDWKADTLPSVAAIAPHLQPTVAAVRKIDSGFESVTYNSLPGASIGASAPVLMVALLPAIQAAREAARRSQSTNNLKQIALAMHNYHDVYKGLPAAYSVDEDDKPLLSWRVHILPFMEQRNLYDQFHLDEPWDSPHNRELIGQIPSIYRSTNSTADPGKTVYLGIGGDDGVFVAPIGERKEPAYPRGIGFRDIRDGTSNTIAVVEASDPVAVIWTKPSDFVPDNDNPLQGLTGMRPGGFLAAFCDGSVRFLADSIDVRTLNGLFTRSAGELLGDFHP